MPQRWRKIVKIGISSLTPRDSYGKNNSMTLEESIQFWLNSSLDDLMTAKAMYEAHRYNYAMFMCQQSLEELLKAILVIQTKNHPPFIHDLISLQKKIDLPFPQFITAALRNINPHYIIARYKPQRFDPEIYNKIMAQKTIKTTEKIIQWFTKKMDLTKYSTNASNISKKG